ncbi:MAG: hypothetical protein HC889_01765 [Synechococcaceae cyanobacterium SM1_2_3]|nr:hypothetical protein [Synechococcaceae cyanobacterium SM1_2_3]
MNRRVLLIKLLRLSAGLPLPLVHAIGAALGEALLWFPNEVRQVARRNLALVFLQCCRRPPTPVAP